MSYLIPNRPMLLFAIDKWQLSGNIYFNFCASIEASSNNFQLVLPTHSRCFEIGFNLLNPISRKEQLVF